MSNTHIRKHKKSYCKVINLRFIITKPGTVCVVGLSIIPCR